MELGIAANTVPVLAGRGLGESMWYKCSQCEEVSQREGRAQEEFSARDSKAEVSLFFFGLETVGVGGTAREPAGVVRSVGWEWQQKKDSI